MGRTILSRRGFVVASAGTAAATLLPRRAGAVTPQELPPVAESYPPIVPRFPHILHGGDWNPDQWLHEPKVIDEDFRLMEKAGCNTFSIGIFAWAALEPEEGRFTFEWLDGIMDRLAAKGWNAFVATPSGAKPRWMSEKYPQVRRINSQGQREVHGSRHNHCFTSPVYREKTKAINTKLAERYKDHKALAAWHISNEYSGTCYCELCLAAFRNWLQTRHASLEALNRAWWTAFWSQTFQSWDQIDPRESPVDGLNLDWQRFITHQTIDFMRAEIAPLRALTPKIPVTTNLMGTFFGLDSWRFGEVCDRCAWDAYPALHGEEVWKQACGLSFIHDIYRSIKGGLPFILMESTPSNTNWQPTPALKPRRLHHQEMLLAVGHGADTTMYFQWRKSRGAAEKTHGAVVDHEGTEKTRVFGDVADHGRRLAKLDALVGTTVRPEVALVYDWDARWALHFTQGPRQGPGDGWNPWEKEYTRTVQEHYRPFWKLGIPVDVIESKAPFDKYRLIVAPMLFLLAPGVAERLEAFVRGGGTLVLTYLGGVVNETNLVFPGGLPGGGLRKVTGVWAEETDSLYPDTKQRIVATAGNALGLSGDFAVSEYAERVHAEGASVLATLGAEFYAGMPALTVNAYGKGKAYYLAARPAGEPFHDAFVRGLMAQLGLRRALDVALPEGMTADLRTGGGKAYVIVHNLVPRPQSLDLGARRLLDLENGAALTGVVPFEPFESKVLLRD